MVAGPWPAVLAFRPPRVVAPSSSWRNLSLIGRRGDCVSHSLLNSYLLTLTCP
jgi:hypothetical protein